MNKKKKHPKEINFFRLAGRDLAKGYIDVATTLFIYALLFWLFLAAVRAVFGIGVDSTDYSSLHRSGLKIYTDYGYGVQYVESKRGLHVRVDQNGKPVKIEEATENE